MKKISFLLFLAASLVFSASCKKKVEEPEPDTRTKSQLLTSTVWIGTEYYVNDVAQPAGIEKNWKFWYQDNMYFTVTYPFNNAPVDKSGQWSLAANDTYIVHTPSGVLPADSWQILELTATRFVVSFQNGTKTYRVVTRPQ